jgi:hypothetical protein
VFINPVDGIPGVSFLLASFRAHFQSLQEIDLRDSIFVVVRPVSYEGSRTLSPLSTGFYVNKYVENPLAMTSGASASQQRAVHGQQSMYNLYWSSVTNNE